MANFTTYKLKNYYYYYFIIIIIAGPFYPICRPTLALPFTKSSLLFTAIRIGYNILCYHGDGSFVKRGRASHGQVPICSF